MGLQGGNINAPSKRKWPILKKKKKKRCKNDNQGIASWGRRRAKRDY